MKIKFKFFINFLVIFFINSFLLFGQQMDNTMISIYNQITNEEQHQAMLNLQLSE